MIDTSTRAIANRGRFEARKLYPYWTLQSCERCGSTKRLQRHHKKHNPTNNSPDNIEILCGSCHYYEHLPEIRRVSRS